MCANVCVYLEVSKHTMWIRVNVPEWGRGGAHVRAAWCQLQLFMDKSTLS